MLHSLLHSPYSIYTPAALHPLLYRIIYYAIYSRHNAVMSVKTLHEAIHSPTYMYSHATACLQVTLDPFWPQLPCRWWGRWQQTTTSTFKCCVPKGNLLGERKLTPIYSHYHNNLLQFCWAIYTIAQPKHDTLLYKKEHEHEHCSLKLSFQQLSIMFMQQMCVNIL